MIGPDIALNKPPTNRAPINPGICNKAYVPKSYSNAVNFLPSDVLPVIAFLGKILKLIIPIFIC
jgi:hypothetical protein